MTGILNWDWPSKARYLVMVVQTHLEIDGTLFRSDPERTCKWIVCLTLYSFVLYLLIATNYIFLFGGEEFILYLSPFSKTYELRGYIYIGR